MGYEKPLPRINGDNRGFWDGCRDHTLKFQQCSDCGHVRWPPADLCPACLSRGHDFLESRGLGRIHTFAVYHQAFHPAFAADLPYTVAIVALDEGPRLLTNIVQCPPEAVRCDMRVTVVWEAVDDTITLPKFRPAS